MPTLVNSADPVPALRQLLAEQNGIPAQGGDQDIGLLVKAAVNLQNQKFGASGVLPVANGGTGVTTSTGSGSTVLSVSPALTGTPTAPTAAGGTNTTQLATTAFVAGAVTSASASVVNPRAPRQGMVMDGTGGSSVSIPAPGTGDFAYFQYVNPTNYAGINGIASGASSSFALYMLNGTGQLNVDKRGAVSVGASSFAVPLNVASLIGYSRTGGVGTFWLDGIAYNTVVDTQNYTVPISFTGAINPITQDPFRGVLGALFAFNRVLTPAEVLALYQEGAPRAADYNSASNTALNTSAWTNYTSAYTSFTGASATGFTAVKASGLGYAQMNPAVQLALAGQSFRVTGTLTLNNGKVVIPQLFVSGATNVPVSINAGAFNVVVPAGKTPDALGLLFTTSGDADYTVSGLVVTRVGLLCAPDAAQPGAGLQWLDASGNRAHLLLPTSGVRWSLPNVSGQIVVEATVTHGGAGNVQLGGASLVDTARQWRVVSITANSTAIATVSVGNVSAGAQYVSGAVLAVGNNDLTLASRFPSTANLWSNSSAAATIRYTVILAPV